MRVIVTKSLLVVGVLCLAIAQPAWCRQRKSAKHAKPVQQEQAAPAPQPTPPPPPPTLAEQPSQPPQVTYQNGQLTIVARNSTLGDILEAVHQKTGAQLDVPSPATERVVTHLGPGPARDVLASLLNGSHFNYVMVGTASNPMALDRVILTPNTGGDVTPPTQAQNAPPQPPAQADQSADDQTDDFASDDSVQEVQPLGSDNNGEDLNQDQQQAQDQQPNNGPNGNARTPEQLLLELQQRQQRQLQLQQGQNGGTPPQPGAPQGFPLPPGQQPQPQPPQ